MPPACHFTLARPALAVAANRDAACYCLNLVSCRPHSSPSAPYEFEIRNQIAAFLLQEGVFTPVSSDVTVYVRSRDPNGTLRGILVDDDRDLEPPATMLAETGRLTITPRAPEVLFRHGRAGGRPEDWSARNSRLHSTPCASPAPSTTPTHPPDMSERR